MLYILIELIIGNAIRCYCFRWWYTAILNFNKMRYTWRTINSTAMLCNVIIYRKENKRFSFYLSALDLVVLTLFPWHLTSPECWRLAGCHLSYTWTQVRQVACISCFSNWRRYMIRDVFFILFLSFLWLKLPFVYPCSMLKL